MEDNTKKEITLEAIAELIKSSSDGIKKDLKSDIAGIKIDIANLKYDVNEIKGEVHEMHEKQDQTITLLDGYVKSTEDAKQEAQIIKSEVGEIKSVIKQKFGVEIRATV